MVAIFEKIPKADSRNTCIGYGTLPNDTYKSRGNVPWKWEWLSKTVTAGKKEERIGTSFLSQDRRVGLGKGPMVACPRDVNLLIESGNYGFGRPQCVKEAYY